jgi:3'-5' exoribonuclease
VEELGTSRRLGYTTRGQLVGHVALGLEILERHVARVEGFPVEIKNMLQHFIVSHHGEIDRGALRRPASPEAIVLHYLDELDARLEQAWRLIDQGPPAEEWTAYVPSLERQLYRWCPLAEDLDPCPRTNSVRCLESSTEAKLTASVEDNGHR